MKKITILAVAVLAMSFASCKKDYKCECTSSYTISGTTYTTVSTTTAKSSKKSATAWCEAGPKATSTTNGVSNPSSSNTPACAVK